MKAVVGLAIFLCLWLSSCNSEPSLQKYFVENTENKNFIALDISSSILNVDPAKLSLEQQQALQSFEKMNIWPSSETQIIRLNSKQNALN